MPSFLRIWERCVFFANTASPVHAGTHAGRSTGGYISQTFATTPGNTYKVTAWVYVTNVSGGSWGGPGVWTSDPRPSGWVNSGSTPSLQDTIPANTWTKVAFSFTPTQTTNILNVGNFGDRTVDVTFDDIEVFAKPTTNTPPTISMSASTPSVGSLPGTVSFSSTGDDADGAIAYYFWDFGDGGKSNLANPSYTYQGNGTYPVTLVVYDDDGGMAAAQTTVTASDPSFPSLTVTSPGAPAYNTWSPTVSFAGTAVGGGGAAITAVTWSTDRGQAGTATGTSSWSFNLDLTNQGGRTRVLIDAVDTNNRLARQDVIVTYFPSAPVGVVNGSAGVTANASSVEQYEKFEATFTIQNTVASNPYLPFDMNVPAGMVPGTGITVNGIFTAPSGKVYTQPGFYYQPFTRNTSTQQLLESGNPVWKIRFAPQELGTWTYQISLTDGSGSSLLSDPSRLKFIVVSPTNPQNHGFLRDAPTDQRYFQFSDGTPFVGVGPSAHIGNSFATDQSVAQVGTGGANLTRDWMSGANVGGSAWAPWSGALPYDGNVPGTALTTSQAYGDGVFSLNLSTAGSPCAFFGFQGVNASVQPNTNYRVMVRVKTVGVTGSGGFTFRPSVGWPNSCNDDVGQPLVIPYQKGTQDWHVAIGTWNSGNNSHLGDSLMTLENVTAGQVYVDEVSIRQDLGNGQLGPEVLPRSNFNTQNYFSQEPSWNWDYGLDQLAQRGIYEKAVIEEKQDYVYNHISPYGFGYASGGLMETATGATLAYQQYLWRYLTARYGYSRAVQSWEYANEEAPANLDMAEQLARYLKANDPQQHLADTSDWAGISATGGYFWQDPAYPDIGYADAHAYVNDGTQSQSTTSWLCQSSTVCNDPFNGGSMISDSALYSSAHSIDQYNKNAAGNKPMVIGEAGIVSGNTTVGQNDTDTTGVWLHQFLWAQLNAGGAYLIYWWDETIVSHHLYSIFAPYRSFMEGSPSDTVNTRIPLTNGKYQDIQLTLPSGIYGWGQKDTTNGGAHFWIYDHNYTWANPSGGTALAGQAVSFAGLPANTYTVQWWNTWTGTYTSQTVTHPGGTMTLTVPGSVTQKDVAVKIIPQNGYGVSAPPPPLPVVTPTPTPTSPQNYSATLPVVK